ncbi:3-deoxy-D-manno-octulosonic acid transferase [Lentisphaerota bacterium ZTH]|nr:3-deoxy-D-manno-octulosonic acid transferase [Lentisphaerota bacterium]WET05606.1 3-deoxy-D-manno-octulosonic acid transferase [Lentisphaerota bacterium ZTH]
MRFIYNILFPLAFIFFIPGMLYKLLRRPGYKKTFPERFGIYSKERKKALEAYKGCIWVHAVSVGEGVIAAAMLKEWSEVNPGHKFVLSTTTTTGQELARKKVPEGVEVIYCPIDFLPFVNRVFNLLSPRMLVIFETEIWPNMIAVARRRNIRTALVNARMSDHSCKGYYRGRLFFKPLLKMFDLIGVQTAQDRERFAAVAPDANVKVMSNMKFDQQVPQNIAPADLSGYFGREAGQTLLAASTHPGEEQLIAAVFKRMSQDFPALKLVIVPRHAERGTEIAGILKQNGIDFRRRSQDDGTGGETVSCLLADTTGEMLKLMMTSDVVIMGKSLAGQDEGHNIIEPALLGKPTVTGGVLKNFRFVLNVFKNDDAIITIDADEQLEPVLRKLFGNAEYRKTLGEKARQAVNAHRGATSRTIKHLEEML